MTPMEHLAQAAKLCIKSHLKDLGEDRKKIKNIKVSVVPSEDTIHIEIECDEDMRETVQNEVIDKCYVLKQLKLTPDIQFV